MRLDIYLTRKGYCETRSKASQLIRSNAVIINGKVCNSKGYDVRDTDIVSLKDNDVLKYVSRGGHKLEKAIESFGLDFKDKIIADIGSSTGGFTDCALQHGAKKVYAIDVGTSQLHESLRNRDDVIVMENTNFRYLDRSVIKDTIDFYVCDVSFISVREILKALIGFGEPFTLMLLFKPQFEVGPEKLGSNGVVRNPLFLREALNDFETFLKENHLILRGSDFSPIKGNKEGNIEFLMLVSTDGKATALDADALVSKAMESLT